jgi:PucR family transcriptional regulator, purine catabolism regulatory protein
MAISVGELLDLPHLALELAAGRAGTATPVHWAHVSEVEDPTPWLEGGELLLTTGLGLPSDAAGQERYLRRLAAARAAGVVFVPDTSPPLTPAFTSTADHLGLPLITTLLKQPFQAISKAVFAANATEESARMVSHLRMYGVLRAAAAESAGPSEVLDRLAGVTRMRLAVVREDGRPQFGRGTVHPRWSEALAAVHALGERARRGLYARLDPGDELPGAYVIQIDLPPPARVFLLVEDDGPAAMPDLVAMHHVATIVAAQIQAQRAERAMRQKLGAALLREAIDGEVGEPTRERLRSLDVGGARLAVVVLRAEPEREVLLADALHDGLLDRDVPALVAAHRGDLLVLAATDGPPETVARAARDIAGAADAGPCAIGAGTAGALEHVPSSYREALVAVGHADPADRAIVAFDEIQAGLAWLPHEPERVALLVERTIGPLLAYDDAHSAELVRSLREVLQARRTPSVAARRLHVHRNTLAYRVRKIESLTGRSLNRIDDQVELWLGLRAHDLGG